jgi:predicted house-cleaning noncanonical NTP pyrophosphatase (MazG superfamily)
MTQPAPVMTPGSPGAGRLVRDRGPILDHAAGRIPVIRVAGDQEYRDKLGATLAIAAEDCVEAGTVPELLDSLTDVLELVYAIGDTIGYPAHSLELIRRVKRRQRGGFTKRLIWSGNRPRPAAVPDPGLGLCQSCVKEPAVLVREDIPYCKDCAGSYDIRSTLGTIS